MIIRTRRRLAASMSHAIATEGHVRANTLHRAAGSLPEASTKRPQRRHGGVEWGGVGWSAWCGCASTRSGPCRLDDACRLHQRQLDGRALQNIHPRYELWPGAVLPSNRCTEGACLPSQHRAQIGCFTGFIGRGLSKLAGHPRQVTQYLYRVHTTSIRQDKARQRQAETSKTLLPAVQGISWMLGLLRILHEVCDSVKPAPMSRLSGGCSR